MEGRKGATMNQVREEAQVLDNTTINEDPLVISQNYIRMQKGILYILGDMPDPGISMRDPINVVNIEGSPYLTCRNIVAAFDENMANHLEGLLEGNNDIKLFFYYRTTTDYEVRHAVTFTLNRKNCATLIGLYEIVKNSIQKEN